ncbi:hypothetical protein COZ40_03080, partial [Candidatus Roizmanbacteria bacterium CG_4_10_14_3_um_filter_39_13]
TDEVISSHLAGEQTIGVYPLFPDNTTSFLAIDFDGSNWLTLIQKVVTIASLNKLFCSIERSKSGNGGHLWFFFSERIPGFLARQLGKLLLRQSDITNRKTFDRMFPSQDEHTGKGYGNLICLPLQGKYAAEGNTIFISPNGEVVPNQWGYLQTIQRVATQEINNYLQQGIKLPVKPQKEKEQNSEEKIQDNAIDEELDTAPVATTQDQETKLVLGANIYIPNLFLPDKLYKYLKKELNFPNPEFYAMERFGYSTWKTPRFIKTLEVLPDGITVPLGFLNKVKGFAEKEQLKAEIIDQRTIAKQISFPSKLLLRKDQQYVLNQLMKEDRVILEAQPGFGKTIVALALMKKRGQKTLIIVHTNTLLHQWEKRINDYFSLAKDEIGLIGDNKWKISKKATIASYMTLSRRGLDDIKNDFGLVIIDECHHIPANTFSTVVKQFTAKHVLGLTATTFRKDKLEKLMYLYVSDQVIRTKNNKQEKNEQSISTVKTELVTRKTEFQGNGKLEDFQDACRMVITDTKRNDQITDDIVAALAAGAKCLVLSERLEHCEILLELVRQKAKGIHAAVATGIMTKKQRERITARMNQERFQLLIATGKLIGEGFDWPAVSHLFLAFPFSWKGKLIQYVGRVQRTCEGKTLAIVHDYFDDQVPMLKLMYFKRLRTYRSLGLAKMESTKKEISRDQLALF